MNVIRSGLFGLVAFVGLVSCGAQSVVLPGERLDIRDGGAASVTPDQSVPIKLSRTVNHNSWSHRGGTNSHRIQHPAFSTAPVQIWAANIGEGNDRRHRITADPVAAKGLIYTLDSRSTVSATSLAGGPVWSRDLTPASDSSDDASGGGLAVVNGQLYVTTGFGDLVALDAAQRGRVVAAAS